MGRKKSYKREDLVARAVEMFRDKGFGATSTQELVEALGVNRFSLYAEFDSKHGLFAAALDRYNAEVIDRSFGPLEKEDAGLRQVRDLIAFYSTAGVGAAHGRGCLLCNTAVELGPLAIGESGFIATYFDRLSAAFMNAFRGAARDGDLPAATSPEAEASLFTAAILGIFVMIRAAADERLIRDACAALELRLDTLDQLSSAKRRSRDQRTT